MIYFLKACIESLCARVTALEGGTGGGGGGTETLTVADNFVLDTTNETLSFDYTDENTDVNTVTADISPLIQKTARFGVQSGQLINNVGAPWNLISFETSATWDDIGIVITSGGDGLLIPEGVYQFSYTLNMFDDNSQRVAHRERFLLTSVVPAGYDSMEGHNYMRDSSGHDSAANVYVDSFKTTQSEALQFQVQTNSSQLNTTSVTGGWLNITKIA